MQTWVNNDRILKKLAIFNNINNFKGTHRIIGIKNGWTCRWDSRIGIR